MKISAAAVLTLLASGVSAFSPKAFVPKKSGLLVPPEVGVDPTVASRMQMVAGGAERAYGQEYYEGE